VLKISLFVIDEDECDDADDGVDGVDAKSLRSEIPINVQSELLSKFF
jgi:hypothetical protein